MYELLWEWIDKLKISDQTFDFNDISSKFLKYMTNNYPNLLNEYFYMEKLEKYNFLIRLKARKGKVTSYFRTSIDVDDNDGNCIIDDDYIDDDYIDDKLEY